MEPSASGAGRGIAERIDGNAPGARLGEDVAQVDVGAGSGEAVDVAIHRRVRPAGVVAAVGVELGGDREAIARAAVRFISEGDEGTVPFVVATNPAAQDAGVSANELIKQISSAVDGRGGGKADLAQGSGKNAAGIDAALAAVRAEIARS